MITRIIDKLRKVVCSQSNKWPKNLPQIYGWRICVPHRFSRTTAFPNALGGNAILISFFTMNSSFCHFLDVRACNRQQLDLWENPKNNTIEMRVVFYGCYYPLNGDLIRNCAHHIGRKYSWPNCFALLG